MENFQKSGKKHLLITGNRGSGKSTFLKKIKESILESGDILPGITTYLIPQTGVMLKDNITEEEQQIGYFCRNENGNMRGMTSRPEGFHGLGVQALARAVSSESEWVTIDEIGFLESKEETFKDALRNIFDKKRVIAVLRKQDLPFINELKNRGDVYVIDLDERLKNVGCVIMASGLSRRFGQNKLMAEVGGKTLIQTILDNTEEVFAKRVVVTRCKEVEELCQNMGIDVIYHELPNRNDTIRLGISRMKEMEAVVFCPCDQPFLQKRTLQKMRNVFSYNESSILRLGYRGTFGAPILFDKKFYDELETLPEKTGGSYLVKKYSKQVAIVEAQCKEELFDIDTPKDYENAIDFLN